MKIRYIEQNGEITKHIELIIGNEDDYDISPEKLVELAKKSVKITDEDVEKYNNQIINPNDIYGTTNKEDLGEDDSFESWKRN